MRNKKFLFICLALLLIFSSATLYSQIRIDLGVLVPRGFGIFSDSETVVIPPEAVKFLETTILPFPEAALYYQFNFGLFKLAGGLRCFTFILESFAWPNINTELHLGDFVLQAQAGGGAFIYFGLANGTETGQVFFPDISAWYKWGTSFRLGGGVLGIFLPELKTSTIPYVWYLGGVFTL